MLPVHRTSPLTISPGRARRTPQTRSRSPPSPRRQRRRLQLQQLWRRKRLANRERPECQWLWSTAFAPAFARVEYGFLDSSLDPHQHISLHLMYIHTCTVHLRNCTYGARLLAGKERPSNVLQRCIYADAAMSSAIGHHVAQLKGRAMVGGVERVVVHVGRCGGLTLGRGGVLE